MAIFGLGSPMGVGGFPGFGQRPNPLMGMLQMVMGLFMGLLTGGLLGRLLNPGGENAFSPLQNPGFGGGGFPGGSPAGNMGGSATNFLGAPGSPGFGNSNAPSVNMNDIKGGTEWGRALAADAGSNANGPGGYCYKWVGQALARHGVNVSGASAYMGADQLAKNPKFREVSVPADQLKSLPPGAVVVWNKGPGHPHGHISIALGDGREASDKIRNQITNYGTSHRVFIPAG